MAYVHAMPKIRAERMLDAASAATATYQQAEWWDALTIRAQGGQQSEALRSSPFSLNGVRMPVAIVRAAMGAAEGVSVEAMAR